MNLDSEKLSFLDSIQSGIIIINTDLTVLFWNDWLEARTSIHKSDILGENLLDFFHYIDEEQLRRKIKFVMNFKAQSFYTVNPHRFLIDIKLNNITNKIFELMQQSVIISPFKYEDKDYIILEIHDVTEYESINLKLNIEKNENKIILDSQSSLIFVATENSIKHINKTALDFLDCNNAADFQNKYNNILEFLKEKCKLPFEIECMGDFLKIIENKSLLIELNDISKDTNLFTLNIVSAEIQDETIYVITLNNVTELEKSKQSLLINSKNAAIGEMISMIAHQWRQPLSAIAANINNINVHKELGMLTNSFLDKKILNINNTLQYMTQTIDDFRNFFKKEDKIKELTIKELLEKSFSIISSSFEENLCKCIFSYDISECTKIYTCANKFDQVILNIYKNSLDEYISKKINGLTKVHVKCSDDKYIIQIQDNAGGIPPSILDKIWDPYFSTKSINGTGIGLYMSKIIVEQHLNGTIKIENISVSSKVTGILCTITLPINLRVL